MTHDGVFHPGHDELHGQTVVVYTSGHQTYIGRWHEVRDDSVLMMDVCVHDDQTNQTARDDWVAHTKKYGVPVEHRSAQVPQPDVTNVVRLRDT
jgi:hypothetical protein